MRTAWDGSLEFLDDVPADFTQIGLHRFDGQAADDARGRLRVLFAEVAAPTPP